MTAPIRLRLDQATRMAVSEGYEHARGAVERTNCQMVLLADEGRHVQEIAWLVRRGPDQVRTVLHRFQAEGLAGLSPRTAPGRALQVTPAWLAELTAGDRSGSPHSVEVPSAVWTTRLLFGVPGTHWPHWPERKPRCRSASPLTPFADVLIQRWEQGCRKGLQL